MQRHLTSTIRNITGAREPKEGRFRWLGSGSLDAMFRPFVNSHVLGEFIKFVCKGYRP
jgi:hypothetical protein